VLTIGSLCTGIGGLDLAVAQHFDATPIWVSDNDPQVSEWLAVRLPDVPNLGDLRQADPSTLKVPDVLTAGWPCQPVSRAGRHRGTDDDRWLFDSIIEFIDRLPERPPLLVVENVPHLLSHDQGRTGLGVVREVAQLGYDLRWGVVRASDAGLPHRRARFFAVATHAERLGAGRGGPRQVPGTPGAREGQGSERQRVRDATGHGHPVTADAQRFGRHEGPGPCEAEPAAQRRPRPGHGGGTSAPDYDLWGEYAGAIRRWELISGINAPLPRNDIGRLDPPFVEWMCGFTPGHVTSIITRRRDSLRLLGNSVCPPQAALALELLTN